MPLEERRERWETLMARLRANDIDHWAQTFLDTLRAAPEDPAGPPNGRRLPRNRVAHVAG